MLRVAEDAHASVLAEAFVALALALRRTPLRDIAMAAGADRRNTLARAGTTTAARRASPAGAEHSSQGR
ncbi:hypothetical protein [Streptomyces mayteni]